ncbi:MAG: PspC domain-containing protein [Flavipsychrobacter sp.]
MQKIIQINIGGRVIPIEEDAYKSLYDYLRALGRNFSSEEGKDEIIQDIENRIAELFATRLENGTAAIDREDVNKVIAILGRPSDLNNDDSTSYTNYTTSSSTFSNYDNQYTSRRLFRNTRDKMLGGVCSGVASYFGIDPVIVRLVFAMLFLAGIGFVAYILAWIIIPAAKTPADFAQMTGEPMTFDTFKKNMTEELQDLKKKGEEMSNELKDFFNKKK